MPRIVPDSFEQVAVFTYRDALRDGTVGRKHIPVLRVRVGGLPTGLAGIMMTSDLQGSGGTAASPRLPLLDAIDLLQRLSSDGSIPPLAEMLALLAGDFWAHLDSRKRGGHGDVRPLWLAVRDAFRAVAGVPGNHDLIGDGIGRIKQFQREHRVYFLDAQVAHVRGLKIDGVSGVIGPLHRPFRRAEEDFLRGLDEVIAEAPNVVVLHQGPLRGTEKRPEVPGIRARCARLRGGLVVFRHDHVDPYFEEIEN